MQLPRRVPWADTAELEQVCAWIYSDPADLDTKLLAIRRLSAWKIVTGLPQALESALSILAVVFEDEKNTYSSYLTLRQSYASAIIRLVNGLVDPLQVGTFARSIASIANQLGLPQWLVEIRHAATHENLPSLELLREAARQAMTWLLHNYWIPAINPVVPTGMQSAPLRPLSPILKHYKRLMKSTTKDAFIKVKRRPEIDSVFKDIERWLAEARVARFTWDSSEVEKRERIALQSLCDCLLKKGCLVPLSKKKGMLPLNSFNPPQVSIQIWSPLLTELQTRYPEFVTILVNQILHIFLTGSFGSDSTSELCLARWAMWALCIQGIDMDVKRNVVSQLVTGLEGPNETRQSPGGQSLLEALCAQDQALVQNLRMLKFDTSGHDNTSSRWSTQDMDIMRNRLSLLLAAVGGMSEDNVETQLTIESTANMGPGWTLAPQWAPLPIGVYR